MTERDQSHKVHYPPYPGRTFIVLTAAVVAAGSVYLGHEPAQGDYAGMMPSHGPDTGPVGPGGYPEVVERLRDLGIPESFLGTGTVTPEDIAKLEAILEDKIGWFDKAIEEYRWIIAENPNDMIVEPTKADPVGVPNTELDELKEARAELAEFLRQIQDQESKLSGIVRLMQANPGINIDSLLRAEGLPKLFEVHENLNRLYTAAHKVSMVGNGMVWTDLGPRYLHEIWALEFTSEKETMIPPRGARAVYDFYIKLQSMGLLDKTDFVVTEGFPTRYHHISDGHKFGFAFDIVFEDRKFPDDVVYKILMETKDDPHFRVLFEPKSTAEANRLIELFCNRSVSEGRFDTYEEAYKWFYKTHVYHWPHGEGVGHFHITAEGGMGPHIDPDGPGPEQSRIS